MKMPSMGSTRFRLCGALTLLTVSVIGVEGFSGEDQALNPSCRYCGMDRTKFAHSRMFIQYQAGSSIGVCSLRCAVIDLALSIDRFPELIQVADYDSHELLEAQQCAWVIGGDRPGVMTKRAKWAFGSNSAAEAFVENHGGRVTDFDNAARAAFEDMYDDVRMIRQRRRSMRE